MSIARTTVQGIYNEARKKLAESLVDGKVLVIGGGEYRLCDGTGKGCGQGGCRDTDAVENHEYNRYGRPIMIMRCLSKKRV
jgi:hypothetical protein